jgi:hypothetical protein
MVAYGVHQKASVSSSGTITFIVKWVYPSNNSPAPNPPAEVFVQQDSSAEWIDIGEEPDPKPLGSASNGLGHSYVTFDVGGRSQGFRLTRMNGSTGEIYVACNVNVQASLEEPSNTGGELQARINYGARTVAPADNYDFNYPPGSDPAGTTPYATTAANYQNKLDGTTGYYTEGRFYTNQSAHHALDQLKKTAVFFVFGHGGAIMQSMQTFWTGTKMTYMVHLPGAKTDLMRQHNIPAGDIVVLEEQPAGAFERVLLAVFLGCATGYDNQSWGCPMRGAYEKGAECTLGFFSRIESDGPDPINNSNDRGAQYWANAFWSYLCKDGMTVEEAKRRATSLITNTTNGLRQPRTRGNTGLRIIPARYGNGNGG